MQPKPQPLDEPTLLRQAGGRARRLLEELERHRRDLGAHAKLPAADAAVPADALNEGTALVDAAADAVRRLLSTLDDVEKNARGDGGAEG